MRGFTLGNMRKTQNFNVRTMLTNSLKKSFLMSWTAIPYVNTFFSNKQATIIF